MVNMGVSFALGKGGEFTRMSKADLIQEVKAVKAENATMKDEVEEVKAENEAMKAENEAMKAKLEALEAIVVKLAAEK